MKIELVELKKQNEQLKLDREQNELQLEKINIEKNDQYDKLLFANKSLEVFFFFDNIYINLNKVKFHFFYFKNQLKDLSSKFQVTSENLNHISQTYNQLYEAYKAVQVGDI